MTDNKTSEAQLKASKKWNAKNPDIVKKSRYKSSTKIYIRDWANEEDLEQIEERIEQKRESK